MHVGECSFSVFFIQYVICDSDWFYVDVIGDETLQVFSPRVSKMDTETQFSPLIWSSLIF